MPNHHAHRLIALCLLAALGACSKADNASGPGGVTVGEAKALDEAAEMLDARPAVHPQVQPVQVQPSPQPSGQPKAEPLAKPAPASQPAPAAKPKV